MDIEDRELAVLEERLYASIHHSYQDAPKIPDVAPAPSPSLRIVSRTSVINNAQATLPGNMKRYWVDSTVSSAGERGPYPKNTPPGAVSQVVAPEKNTNPESNKEGGNSEAKKMFLAPYQSLLGNMDDKASENQPSVPVVASPKSTVPERATVQKDAPKEPELQLKKKKQTKQTTQYVEKKLESLLKLINKDRKENAMQTLESKKAKANKVRNRKRQQVIVAKITLNSSDEDSQPAKEGESNAVPVSDGEGDEVIIIPTPPPPQICIDCSDEEETQSIQFALPKSKKSKKKGHTVVNSSRCGSPSNSSIMSDDFIGQHDRSRLNDSFTGSIPSDDELECSMEGMSGKAMKDANDARQERVPSISSEDTVCTSGDTTDQEKHPPATGPGKGITTSKSQAPGSSSGNTTNAKSKKESAATKKTPAKQKPSKMAISTPNVEAAISPSTVSKRNANSKINSGAISSNSTSNASKTPGKSKARCKSPVETLAMGKIRKKVETQQSSEGSGKKAKAKKDGPSLKVTRSMSKSITQATAAAGTASDKPTERIKNGNACKHNTGTKSKSKKIQTIDDNVSSESDIDIFPKTNNTSTPQALEKSSRRSFVEQLDDVSSESDYDDSFLHSKKLAGKQKVEREPKKRIGRKRKQYNSETYSDEDFACLLTDIVRAVSDTEEEDDDTTEVADNVNNESNAKKTAAANPVSNENCVEEQPSPSSKQDRNLKKKRKLKHVPPDANNAVGIMQPDNNKTDPQQLSLPGLVVKKKKKLKDPKSSVKIHAGSSSSSSIPEIQSDRLEKAHCPANAVQQSQVIKRKERSDNAATVPLQLISLDSTDEDVQIIENIQCHFVSGTSGESSKKTQTIGPECAWNEEMKQFYNDSWTGEDLNMDLVLGRMPYDSRHWPIVHKDRFPDPPKKDVTCSNCGDRGHMQYKCRNAPKLPICHMCGEQGHKEPRCPKTICLNCGAKTRTFVRGCKSCARDADITCFSCGLRGHTQRSCPDLWRRYHSTIEDNIPLREECEKNPNARWCSICGKPGHQAYICNDARRIFSHAIPNMRVSSYMPAYRGEYNRFSKHRNDEQERRLATDPTARYNLFSTDANDSEFNLSELANNENGFYYNFLKATGLLEKYERRVSNDLEENLMQQPQAIVQPVAKAQHLESTRPEHTVSHIAETTNKPEPETTEQTTCVTEVCKQKPIISAASEVPVVEENSNYSFSEFHTEEIQLDEARQNVDIMPPPSDNFVPTETNNSGQLMLSDYIPLTTDSVETQSLPLPEPQMPPALSPVLPPATEAAQTELVINSAPDSIVIPQQEAKVDENAKVLLTQDRATLLLSAKGTEFLKESGKKHSVQLSITFEEIGRVLLITGTHEAQDKFHSELLRYLAETEDYMKNEKYFRVTGPKFSDKMTLYIAKVLRGLEHEKQSVEELLKKLRNAMSTDKKEKIRRRLNVQLFGVYGLRKGRMHLHLLRAQLAMCRKADPSKSEVPQGRRNIIDEAVRYIFSAYDHKHYDQFVKEYEERKKANKLKVLTYSDLKLPRTIEKPPTSQDAVKKQKAKENRNAKLKEKLDDRADKDYAYFLRKATTYRPNQPNRPNQDVNTSRHIQQTQGTEYKANPQEPHHSRHYNNGQWNREDPAARQDRYHWQRRPEALDQGHPNSTNTSWLADRGYTLREQELIQLQILQDLLR